MPRVVSAPPQPARHLELTAGNRSLTLGLALPTIVLLVPLLALCLVGRRR
jgi:hypothetical protein